MAGVRLGWLITKNRELYSKFIKIKDYTSLCASAPSEILSLIALRERNKIISRNVKLLKSNLALLDKFFTKYSSLFSWVRPKAGPVCFPKLLSSQTSTEFCRQVLENAQVMLSPSPLFDYGDKHFRLGYGRANMPEALKALEDYLDKK